MLRCLKLFRDAVFKFMSVKAGDSPVTRGYVIFLFLLCDNEPIKTVYFSVVAVMLQQ